MTRTLVYFPEVAIQMNIEIVEHHPELAKLLSKYPHRPLEIKLATIAAYCKIAVDGDFREKDLESLFEMLLKKLKDKSTIIVTS